MNDFGNRVRDLRNAAQLKQDALAPLIGISQGQLSKIENGTASISREAATELLPKIATALGTTLWGLAGGTEYAELVAGDSLVTVEGDGAIRWLAYFASALTGLTSEQKDALNAEAAAVRGVCEQHHTFLYEPRQYTDPVLHPQINSARVYTIDRAQVSESDLVILHCGHPSFGAGQELEIATAAGVPIILLASESTRVSRMVLGSYARAWPVNYSDLSSLQVELSRAVTEVLNDLAMRMRLEPCELGQRVRKLREERSLQRALVAQAIGLTEAALMDLETGAAHRVNPSLATLRRLAAFLKTSVSYLVEGIQHRPEDTDCVLRRSQETLHRFATGDQLSHTRTQDLWTAFFLEYQTQRRAVAEARTEPLTEEDWAARHKGGSESDQMSFQLEGME